MYMDTSLTTIDVVSMYIDKYTVRTGKMGCGWTIDDFYTSMIHNMGNLYVDKSFTHVFQIQLRNKCICVNWSEELATYLYLGIAPVL